MDRLTAALIAVGVGIGVLAMRQARRSERPAAALPTATDAPVGSGRQGAERSGDNGMVVLRNEPIDNGMVVRSPFNEDPGMLRAAGGRGSAVGG